MINKQKEMQGDVLNEREFELINIIGEKLGANQRELSKLLALSLGMTNMLIKRLIEKGHIRINQLNKRKVEYMLTPKGFAEKTRKSVRYTLKTINSIGLIRKRIEEVIRKLHDKGKTKYYILGESDLVALVEMAFLSMHLKDCSIERVKDIPKEKVDGIILICKEETSVEGENKDNSLDMIEELSKDHNLLNNINGKE